MNVKIVFLGKLRSFQGCHCTNPPPWIPKPEVSVVSVQPQDSSIKDDDEVPYSSSDEEEMVTVNKFMNVKNALKTGKLSSSCHAFVP